MSTDEYQCPQCHTEWANVLETDRVLSSAGYLHTDTTHLCTECGHEWVHGHPEGQGIRRNYTCPVCREADLRPHKIDPQADPVHADMKCPNCHFWSDSVSLVGLSNGEYTFAYDGLVGEQSD